jgi:HNH endonuclease
MAVRYLSMRGTISRRGQSTPTQRLWINQNDFLQVGLHRMADSTRLLICTNPERGHLSGCEFTRKSSQEYGRTTASFHLIDSWRERDKYREVFKYRLVAVEGDESFDSPPQRNVQRRRVIPTSVKLTVWKRDGGKCVICGATDELHFDHDLPWSKGGTSITAENVQLLCVRHNLQKHDHIV